MAQLKKEEEVPLMANEVILALWRDKCTLISFLPKDLLDMLSNYYIYARWLGATKDSFGKQNITFVAPEYRTHAMGFCPVDGGFLLGCGPALVEYQLPSGSLVRKLPLLGSDIWHVVKRGDVILLAMISGVTDQVPIEPRSVWYVYPVLWRDRVFVASITSIHARTFPALEPIAVIWRIPKERCTFVATEEYLFGVCDSERSYESIDILTIIRNKNKIGGELCVWDAATLELTSTRSVASNAETAVRACGRNRVACVFPQHVKVFEFDAGTIKEIISLDVSFKGIALWGDIMLGAGSHRMHVWNLSSQKSFSVALASAANSNSNLYFWKDGFIYAPHQQPPQFYTLLQ